jgi:glycosyltransferase involved in cell wall biosynthesis
MRIAICSTFPPQRCGLASYTHSLAVELGRQGHHVLIAAERADNCAHANHGPVSAQRVWDRRTDWVGDIVDALAPHRPDVIHIQHSPGVFGLDERLGELCRRLRHAGAATVVTLHTVHTIRSAYLERLFDVRKFYRSLADHCDATIIHQAHTALESLRRNGLSSDQIAVIPHGTSMLERPSQRSARARLGLSSDERVLLLFGFIHPQKNLAPIIRAMHRMSEADSVRLLVVGSLQNAAWYNMLYLKALERLAKPNGHPSRVEFRIGFVPDAEVPWYFAASDLVLLPHWQGYGSASGVLHTSLAAGRPVMVSQSPKFGDIASLVGPAFCVPPRGIDAWAVRLDAVLSNPDVLSEASRRLAGYAEETSWDNVTRKTSLLYEQVLQRVSGGCS